MSLGSQALQNLMLILVSVLLIALSVQNIILKRKYKKLFQNSKGDSLEGVLVEQIQKAEKMEKDLKKAFNDIAKIEEKAKGMLQKAKIQRYSAFNETGSDQSFTISLLDGNNNGLIMTGLHMRDEAKVYAKPVEKGVSRYKLSDEEEAILKEALK